MKLKKLEISLNCCENCKWVVGECCWHPSLEISTDIPDKRIIPDFCPLPDYEEKEEKK
jgi:hypothetical protein